MSITIQNVEVCPLHKYLTIKKAVQKYPDLFETEGVLRNLIWKANDRHSSIGTIKGNGLATAIIRLGRKVVLDESKLLSWIESHKETPHVF